MTTPSDFVPDYLAKRAALTPDRVALVEGVGGPSVTFAEWDARVNRTVAWLRSVGVGHGDVVAAYASNHPAYLDLFWAANKLGFVLQNLNWRLTLHELREVVADADPVLLLHTDEFAEQAIELGRSSASITRVVSFEGDEFASRDAFAADPTDRPELAPDDVWGIYYTGGTTGLPKGAMLTHGNIAWNSINTVMSWGLTADHAAPLQLPFFHVGGPNIFMVPLVHVGGTTVLCGGYDLGETFDMIDSGDITHYVAVPTMYQMMQADPRWEEADFSRLALVISGGAPCPLPIMERFWDKGVDFKMGYGLTEAAGNNFWLPAELIREKPTSVGYPIFHIDMQVVDDDGNPCPPGVAGELLIRGPHVMAGYWGRPEATAEVLRDGWLHTGDLAVVDEDGCYSIKGRSKEMFISGGENVYPAEVESVMQSHPHVVEAALVGVPDETWGEVGLACLVVSADWDEQAFMAWLAERVAKYKLPRTIRVYDELPKTAIGKLDKKRMAGGTA